MCEGSLYVQHRQATARESLQVQILAGHPHMRGLYPQDQSGGDNKLVCIRKPTEAVIGTVRFEHDAPQAVMQAYEGKRRVTVSVRRMAYNDVVAFPDGSMCNLAQIRVGTRFEIGEPAAITGKPGLNAVKAALTEQDKTEPTPEPASVAKTIKKVVEGVRRRSRAKNAPDTVEGDD